MIVALSFSACLCYCLATEQKQQQQQPQNDKNSEQNFSEEMHLITKSLDDLMGELTAIKQEANGRLSNMVKNRASTSNQERIRQTKVSRFVLKRVAELESESLIMKEELNKLFKVEPKKSNRVGQQGKQEDHDFDEPALSSLATTTSESGMPATTTKPTAEEQEAAKLGFDMEALKKLGEEIGKRLDQFGKDTAKNLGDLIEGVKLVFREPAKQQQQQPSTRALLNATINDDSVPTTPLIITDKLCSDQTTTTAANS